MVAQQCCNITISLSLRQLLYALLIIHSVRKAVHFFYSQSVKINHAQLELIDLQKSKLISLPGGVVIAINKL